MECESGEEGEGFVLEEAVDEAVWRSCGRKRRVIQSSSELESEEKEEPSAGEEGDAIPGHLRWKEGLVEKAVTAYGRRQSSSTHLHKLIYLNMPPAGGGKEGAEVAGLFTVTRKHTESVLHMQDSSLVPTKSITPDWTDASALSAVKALFVTGGWGAEDARTLLEEDNVYGDFEDLETGERIEGREEGGESTWLQQKQERKAAFDVEYDAGKEEGRYLEDLKREVSEQTEVNQAEFRDLDDQARVQYVGVRPGSYVRMEVKGE